MKTLLMLALLSSSAWVSAATETWSLASSWDNLNNGMKTCQYYSGERTQYLFVERYEACPNTLEY